MDNKQLQDIKNRIDMLPLMKERLSKLQDRVRAAEQEVEALLDSYNKESMDVEKLKSERLSVYILKTIGRYEGKLNKETEEQLSAKLRYDKALEAVNGLKKQEAELIERVAQLNREKDMFETELDKREEEIRNSFSSEAALLYKQLQASQDICSKQLIEINEAISAANRALDTLDTAIEHLNSAEGWATYDIWFKSGIIGHMAKYGHIDDAGEAFSRLSSQLHELKNELDDVNMSLNVEFEGVDSATRTVDFWFDNIFTDLNVRDTIRNDSEQASKLRSKINGIISRLESNRVQVRGKVKDIEKQRTELIMTYSR